ncbi:MAG TPA: VWA domain-containing protein [Vicinamibacterales bacterium]|jgi:VWFA-related protein|nr:VWA domain-containing protein [Vicinamibacterales bacterium]
MAWRFIPGVCLFVAVAAASIPAAQDQTASPQQPTFRGSIQSVRVDLYATRDGKPVTDLRRDEVQLFEDGTPQAIQTFEPIAFAAPKPGAALEPRTPDENRQMVTDPRSRLFVIFVPGRSTTPAGANLAQIRIPVIRYINTLLGPDDLVAVMTPDTRIGELTFHRRLPVDSRTWFEEMPEDPRLTSWDLCYPSYIPGSPNAEMKGRLRELMTFEALDALIDHLAGLREERKHVFLLTEGFRLYQRNPNLGAALRAAGRTPADPAPAPRVGESTTTLSTRQCESDLADLASLEHANRLNEIEAHAKRSNVSFYPISPAGLTPASNRRGRIGAGGFSSNRTLSERQSALRSLAEDTGGIPIVNTDDVEGHLQKIMTATSSYYLIGYSPTRSDIDGRLRRITVKVSRPNVQVRARTAYVALPPIESRSMPVIDTARPQVPIETAMQALSVSRSSLLNFRSSAWTRSNSSGASAVALWIVAELDPQSRPESSKAGATAELTLRPVRSGPSPSLRAGQTVSRQVSVSPGDSEVVFELRDSDGPLVSGDYSAQLTVTSASGDPVGEFGRVTVPETPSPLGEAVLLRRTAASGQRFVRTADPRFQRTDRLRLELPTDATGAPTAVLRDRRGAELPVPLQVTTRPDESRGFRWIVVDVPVLSLAPGDYAVESAVGGATQLTAFRLTP